MTTPEFTPKRISADGVASALDRAVRYRLLNEPREAESICRDVLEIDPDNQQALKTLLLALSDQSMAGGARAAEAYDLATRFSSEYDRIYYQGVLAEREAKARLSRGASGPVVYDLLRKAMTLFEQAEGLAEPGNDEAILRWNTCARLIAADDRIRPHEDDAAAAHLADEDVPLR